MKKVATLKLKDITEHNTRIDDLKNDEFSQIEKLSREY